MKNFKKLLVLKKGMKIFKFTYKIALQLPKQGMYGVISEIQRASSSIPANIAEGSSRSSSQDFNRFLEIAPGSCFELETFLLGINEIDIYRKGFIEDKNVKVAN